MPCSLHSPAVISVIRLCLICALAVGSSHAIAEQDTEDAAVAGPVYVSLGKSLVINLARNSRAHYVRASMQLETVDAANAAELEHHLPVVRDYMISAIGGRTHTTVSSAEGQNALRADLLEGLNERLEEQLGKPLVESIYFTEYFVE